MVQLRSINQSLNQKPNEAANPNVDSNQKANLVDEYDAWGRLID